MDSGVTGGTPIASGGLSVMDFAWGGAGLGLGTEVVTLCSPGVPYGIVEGRSTSIRGLASCGPDGLSIWVRGRDRALPESVAAGDGSPAASETGGETRFSFAISSCTTAIPAVEPLEASGARIVGEPSMVVMIVMVWSCAIISAWSMSLSPSSFQKL